MKKIKRRNKIINTLTPAQRELIPVIRNKWLKKLFDCTRRIDRAKATEGINWLYEISGLQKPMIIYVNSPLACQYAVQFIKSILKANKDDVRIQAWEQVWAQVRFQVWNQVRDQVGDQVWDRFWDHVEYVDSPLACQYIVQFLKSILKANTDEVGDQISHPGRDQLEDLFEVQNRYYVGNEVCKPVWTQVRDQVWTPVHAKVRNQLGDQEYYYFSDLGNVGDYGMLAYYDYFKTIGVLQHENFDKFLNLVDSGIYDMIQLRNFCIVSELPIKIIRNNQNRLHCESGSAIEWADGYGQYYWSGVSVNKDLIETPDLITKEEILKESNTEVRRCMREKLGVEEYYNRLGGVILIDEDADDQGNIMKLFRSKEIDSLIKKHVQYLQVICPSTRREYILYPTNQKSKNVWEAKASTFQDEKIQYRHGDVGLLNVNKQFSKPSDES